MAKDLMGDMVGRRKELLADGMTVVEWFDPSKSDHMEAFKVLRKSGQWPKGFIPEGLEFPGTWVVLLNEKVLKHMMEENSTTEIRRRFHQYLRKGMSTSDALAQVSKELGVDWDIVDQAVGLSKGGQERKLKEAPEDNVPPGAPDAEETEPEGEEGEPIVQAEEPAADVDLEKIYLGQAGDTHFYVVSDKNEAGMTEDLQVTDQEGNVIVSAKESGLDIGDVSAFILGAIQDEALQGAQLERSVVMQYLVPQVEAELEEPEGELGNEPGAGKEKPAPGEEEEQPAEENPVPRESRVKESKEAPGMLVEDAKGNSFSVELVDEGTAGETVLSINGREFRFQEAMVKVFADNGELTDESIKELVLQTLGHLGEPDYAELVGQGVREDMAQTGVPVVPNQLTKKPEADVMEDDIPGGLASKKKELTVKPEQVEMGVEVEMEHTDDPRKAVEIALDHLSEDPDYYTKLAGMEQGKKAPEKGVPGNEGKVPQDADPEDKKIKLLSEAIEDITSYKDAGYLTSDVGFVMTLTNGQKFTVTISEDRRHGREGDVDAAQVYQLMTSLLEEFAVELGSGEEEEPDEPEECRMSKMREGEGSFQVGDQVQIQDAEGNTTVVPQATVKAVDEMLGDDGEMHPAIEITGSDNEDEQEWYQVDQYQISLLKSAKEGKVPQDTDSEDKKIQQLKENTKLNEFLGDELEQRNDVLFKKLVPTSGPADTLEGEMLRAMNRLVYRYYNDGDYFYEGYGTNTAGPAHAFLSSMSGAVPGLQKALAELYDARDEAYEEGLTGVANSVLNYIESRDGKYTKNTEDMLDYESEFEDEEDAEYESRAGGTPSVTEGVLELVGEADGLSPEDVNAVRKAVEDGRIDAEWPSDEEMIDALSGLEDVVDPMTAGEEPDVVRTAYLRHILVPKAIATSGAGEEGMKEELKGQDPDMAKALMRNLRRRMGQGEEISAGEQNLLNQLEKVYGPLEEGEYSDMAGSTFKKVFQVDYLTDTGEEKSTRVIAQDEREAGAMLTRQKGVKSVVRAELVKEAAKEGVEEGKDYSSMSKDQLEAELDQARKRVERFGRTQQSAELKKAAEDEVAKIEAALNSVEEGQAPDEEPVKDKLTDDEARALRTAESLLGFPNEPLKMDEYAVGDLVQIVKRKNFEMVVDETIIRQMDKDRGVEITGNTIPEKQQWFDPKHYMVIKL